MNAAKGKNTPKTVPLTTHTHTHRKEALLSLDAAIFTVTINNSSIKASEIGQKKNSINTFQGLHSMWLSKSTDHTPSKKQIHLTSKINTILIYLGKMNKSFTEYLNSLHTILFPILFHFV